jgi:Type VI secretion system/phage-baseplate injector OB domain
MRRLFAEANMAAQQAIAEDGGWLMGVPATVADNADPEKQHRVRVVIPSIDEDLIFDEWARQMVFCLGSEFGTAFVPPKGSEVVLFGRLGQKHHLYYASLYNEEMLQPPNFENEMSVGIRAPGNMTFIAIELLKLVARNVHVIAEMLVRITGQNIESLASQLNKITGQTIESTATGQNKIAGSDVRLEGSQIRLQGSAVTINGDGSISVQGGNVAIGGNSVTIHGRTVNKVGPSI